MAILLSEAFTVVMALPLLIVRLVPAPVTLFADELPIVMIPLVVVNVLVSPPPNVRLPFRVMTPVLVVRLPAFQTIGPEMMKAPSVLVAADKLWATVKVPVVVNVTESLNSRAACVVISPK